MSQVSVPDSLQKSLVKSPKQAYRFRDRIHFGNFFVCVRVFSYLLFWFCHKRKGLERAFLPCAEFLAGAEWVLPDPYSFYRDPLVFNGFHPFSMFSIIFP